MLDIMGTTSMMVMLASTLEVDLGEITVSCADFSQYLMGIDVMSGLQGVM